MKTNILYIEWEKNIYSYSYIKFFSQIRVQGKNSICFLSINLSLKTIVYSFEF